jgi:hypothetical protein
VNAALAVEIMEGYSVVRFMSLTEACFVSAVFTHS